MAVNMFEAKAHKLIGELNPDKRAAIVHLLEVMVDEEEPLTSEERRRFDEGDARFAPRGGNGIPMEDVLAEYGLTGSIEPRQT